MKFDDKRKMFIPTKEEIAEISPYELSEFEEHFENFSKWLTHHTSKVYDIMYNAYSQKAGKQEHHQCIRLRIYLNLAGEKQALIEAVHELLLGAITGEMDMEEYDSATGKRVIPQGVMDKLERAELIVEGKLFCQIPSGVEKYV